MITDHEWALISAKAFPKKPEKAPPFLWTRILARIEAEETRRESTWWLQWRWMSRLTMAVGLLVSVGAFYLFQHAMIPLDAALDGRSNQHEAIQVAVSDMTTPDESAILVVGLDS